MSAQFTLEDSEGNLIADGTVLTFNSIIYDEASWDFYVNNTSTTDDIYMKIEFVSAINTNGSMMELCFGLCYTGIIIGNHYPPNSEYVEIAPGGQTLPGNHLYSSDPGNGTDTIEYVFRYYQVDATGNNEIGTPLTITYIYDPLLGTEDFNELNAEILSTVIDTEMVINTVEELNVAVYNLLGQKIKEQNIGVGRQVIDMSDLSSQTYLVQLNNKLGSSKTIKVIVK